MYHQLKCDNSPVVQHVQFSLRILWQFDRIVQKLSNKFSLFDHALQLLNTDYNL